MVRSLITLHHLFKTLFAKEYTGTKRSGIGLSLLGSSDLTDERETVILNFKIRYIYLGIRKRGKFTDDKGTHRKQIRYTVYCLYINLRLGELRPKLYVLQLNTSTKLI